MEIIFKNSWLAYKNRIYIIKQEGLFQNKVNSSLVFTWNCKMGYWHHFTCFSCKQTSCLLTAVCSGSISSAFTYDGIVMKLKKGFLKEHVSEHDANIRLEDYSTTLNEPEVNNCFSIYTRSDISRIGEEFIKKTISLIDGWIRAWTLYSLWKRWHQWLKRKRRKFQLLFLLRRNVELYLLPSTHREWVTSFCRFLPIT